MVIGSGWLGFNGMGVIKGTGCENGDMLEGREYR